MTGGAGAGAAAFGLNAGNVVLDRRFHHGRAHFGVDGAGRSGGIDIGDLGHALGAAHRRKIRPDGRAASSNGSAPVALVSRTRSSHYCAAGTSANFGFKGTLESLAFLVSLWFGSSLGAR